MNTKNILQFSSVVLVLTLIVAAPANVVAFQPEQPSETALQQEDEIREKAKTRLSQLYKDLEMSRDQYNNAWNAVYNYVEELHDVQKVATEDGDKDAAITRFKKIKKNYKERMKGVLDEEQYEKFAKKDWKKEDQEKIKSLAE